MSENRYAALDDYALRHLPSHLAEAGRREALLTLMNLEFGTAVRERTRSDALFTTQLGMARAEALDPESRDIPAALRLMFTEVGLTAAADALSPWVPVLVARVGELDHALDLAQLIRADEVKATALVTLLRCAIADGTLTTSTARRARQIGELLFAGRHGVAVLVAVADALRTAGEHSEALEMLAIAKGAVAAQATRGSVNAREVTDVASAYLRADELQEAIASADFDPLGIEATPVRTAIVRRALELGRPEAARAAVTAGAGIPDWVNADYGLRGEDLFAFAAGADAAGLPAVARKIRTRAFANGRDKYVDELLAKAREAGRSGNGKETVRLLSAAARKAADELNAFPAEDWAAVARAAHDLNRVALRDEALDRSLETALVEDVYRIGDDVTELLDIAKAAGRLEQVLPPLTRYLANGPFVRDRDWASSADDDILGKSWVVGAWADLLVKVAKADPHAPTERLREAQKEILRRAAPAGSVGVLGMGFADVGGLDDVRHVLKLLETLRRPRTTDEAKALVLDSCAIESLRLGDKHTASAWLEEARALTALTDAVNQPNENSGDGSLEWAALHILRRHLASGSGHADMRAWADLLPELPSPVDKPEAALNKARRQEEAMGGAIGNVSTEIPIRVAEAVVGFLLTGRHIDAMSACREVTYWRLLTYTQTSPLDAEEGGTYELIFETSRIHAACLVRVAEAAAPVGSVAAELGSALLAETGRIPYDGVRYCARLGIGEALARSADPSSVATAFLEQSLSSGRDETLASTAAVMPMLAAIEDASFLRAVHDQLALAGDRWEPPAPITIRSARSTGGLFRTFNLV
jgi:hypothetical protein